MRVSPGLLVLLLTLSPISSALAGPVTLLGSGVVTEPGPVGLTAFLDGRIELPDTPVLPVGTRFEFRISDLSPGAMVVLEEFSALGQARILDVPLTALMAGPDSLTFRFSSGTGAFFEVFDLTLRNPLTTDRTDPRFLSQLDSLAAEIAITSICIVCDLTALRLSSDNQTLRGRVDRLRVAPEPATAALLAFGLFALGMRRRSRVPRKPTH
jgi:hypothetical protein